MNAFPLYLGYLWQRDVFERIYADFTPEQHEQAREASIRG